MNQRLVLVCLAAWLQTAWAKDYTEALRELGGLGKGVTQNIQQPNQFVPRYNAAPPMAEQYYGGGISLPTQYGEDKIARCASEKAHTDLYLRQECEGVNMIAGNKTRRPDITQSANEKLVQGTTKIAGNPKETLDKYKWKYPVNADGSIGSVPETACPVETIQVPATTKEKDCRRYNGAERYLCEAALQVNVDPNWNYSCLETKYRNQQHQCSKKLVVVCERAPDCAEAGVKTGTEQGDMQVQREHLGGGIYQLNFGLARTHTWGAEVENDKIFDRSLTLDVKNLSDLQTFQLTKVDWDDWTIIKVNGTVVWSTSLYRGLGQYAGKLADGDMRWIEDPYSSWTGRYDGWKVVEPETGNIVGKVHQWNRDSRNVNIDLRPYLREGNNQIFVRTMVVEGGNLWLTFKFQNYCPPVCQERWENQCAEWERTL